jgi:tetratricopeptide (TPR) repeat protein
MRGKISFWIIGILVLIFVGLSPLFNYSIGNIFFGQVPKLYNVNLAHMFFHNASYPLIGKSAPYAHHQLSRTYFIQGDLTMALDEAQKEVELYPGHLATYYIVGLTYGYMNREKLAIEAFSKYIEYQPTAWAPRNDKAWLQFRAGDIDGALKTITPVASSTNPWVQNTYGTLLMNKKRYKEAKVAFETAWNTVKNMTEDSWGRAYPGNDPRIYGTGLEAMRTSIQNNLKLLEGKI